MFRCNIHPHSSGISANSSKALWRCSWQHCWFLDPLIDSEDEGDFFTETSAIVIKRTVLFIITAIRVTSPTNFFCLILFLHIVVRLHAKNVWVLRKTFTVCVIYCFVPIIILCLKLKLKLKLHGLSPRANYTGRATAACRRSDCQLLRIEGAT
jgi:hypothetical protein